MLRLPPFDKIGATPTPDFTNADPTNGVQGSIVNGQVFNQLQHEAENLELLAGLTPDGSNLYQWTQAVSRGGIWVDELTGTGDLAVANLDAVLPALLRGMRIGAVATAANTVTNPKLRVLNLGSSGGYTDFPIFKEDGSALVAGDLVAGKRYRFEADGAGNVMVSGGGIVSGSILKLTPKGQTRTSRFTPNVVLSDLPAVNTPYTTQTVTISGASYVVLTSYVGVRNNQPSPTGVISYITNSAGGTSQYLGCVILNGVQIPLPIRATFIGLNPTQTYTFSQVVQKDSAVGPILALDAYLLAEHDGN